MFQQIQVILVEEVVRFPRQNDMFEDTLVCSCRPRPSNMLHQLEFLKHIKICYPHHKSGVSELNGTKFGLLGSMLRTTLR